ncbi:methyl-accepting chemotaxis protein [Roseomonas sp. M0104]|uniref:Methyl-accepting chemotaxis protein n=1 Tax=Teichococcus coralli TaxID=2545983 RepID=A0A845BAB2_9PROT|nr:methyl-accepting chemotaxis protein [Pseudoroseomonas coralli]MXP62307.1 methyl-accepting chemotaxis protein [Pseudoroseomonas coralli]
MPAPATSKSLGLVGRLLLLAVLPLIAGVGLTAFGADWAGRTGRAPLEQQAAEQAAEQARLAVEAMETRMAGYAAALSLRPDLVATIVKGGPATTDALRPLAVEALAVLRTADPTVALLEISDARGRILIRGHNPAVAGDDKSRVPDVAEALRGTLAHGAVVSPSSGHLAVGAVAPLRVQPDGPVLGTLKVGGAFNAETAAMLARRARTEILLFGAGRMAASTLPSVESTALPAEWQQAAASAQPRLLRLGNQDFRAVPVAIHGADGATQGLIVTLLPLASWQEVGTRGLVVILLVGGAVLLLAGPVAWLAAARLARPLTGVARALHRMASGDLAPQPLKPSRVPEIRAMLAGLDSFSAAAQRARALEEEATAAAQAAAARRREATLALAQQVEEALGAVAAQLGTSASALDRSSGQLGAAADSAASMASSARAEAGRASEDVQAVATAAEEMAASVNEITRRVTEAAATARQAAQQVGTTDQTVRTLADGAQQIAAVVDLIRDIASRTNLLALNATIEAARAGESGKGFAIVAHEVKQLATQTARATEEIASQISAIQAAAGQALQAVDGISGTAEQNSNIAAGIAAAVEQQSAATQEIARAAAAAASHTRGAAREIEGVVGGATEAAAAVETVRGASGEVARQSVTLRDNLNRLLGRLREAA